MQNKVIQLTTFVVISSLLLGCSQNSANLTAPLITPQNPDNNSYIGTQQLERVMMGEVTLVVNFNNCEVWLKQADASERHMSAIHYDSTGGFDLTVDGSFVTGGEIPAKLGARNCMRVTATLRNTLGQDMYDVRWVFKQEDLDLKHLYFVNPSGYTDLFDGDGSRSPYRAFMTDEFPGTRLFPADAVSEEHMMFLLTEEQAGAEEIIEIRTTIDATWNPCAEEPVGIFMGVPPDQRLVLNVDNIQCQTDHTYWLLDHDSNWDDIDISVNQLFDFPSEGSLTADVVDFQKPSGPDAWAEISVNYLLSNNLRGGLYELPLIFTDTSETDDFTGPFFHSDAIEQTQYFYYSWTPQLLNHGPGPNDFLMPVATSPAIMDFGDGGQPEFVAVYRDQVVTMLKDSGSGYVHPWPDWTPSYPPVQFNRKLFCLGSPAFSDQNLDGYKDIIIGFAMIADWGGLTNVCQGRIYCIDGATGSTLWYKTYAEGVGDVIASPIIIDLPGDDREEVIVMLDRPSVYQDHIEVLRWSGDSQTDVDIIRSVEVIDGVNRSEGIRSNGALVHPDYTGGDIWLACIGAGNTDTRKVFDNSYLHIYNLTPTTPIEVCTPVNIDDIAAPTHPADILGLDFVHVGVVTGDVNGDGQFEVIVPRRRVLKVYNSSLTSYELITYSEIDADQLLDTISVPESCTTLATNQSMSDCRNVASLPALGDINRDGKPDIVLALEAWIVVLTWDEFDYNSEQPGKYPCFDSIWTHHVPNAHFWANPILLDFTRDGFLDVIVSAGGFNGPGYNLVGIDGSPANNHHFGVTSDRVLWTNDDFLEFQAIGQGPAAWNADGELGTTVHVGSVWSQYSSPCMSTWGLYDTKYEGHGVKERFPPPNPEPAWSRHLADSFNSGCYGYSQ